MGNHGRPCSQTVEKPAVTESVDERAIGRDLWHVHKNKPQQFQYADSWLNSPHGRMLSLSMPFQPGNAPFAGDVVEHFFDNLLPDNKDIRRRIQQNFGIPGTSPFDLLAEIGRDCVGASNYCRKVMSLPVGTG